jgi:hypothetical protein
MIEIETLKRVRLRDNDIVVLKHRDKLSVYAIDCIAKSFKRLFSKLPQKNLQVVVLEEGMDVEVLGKEDLE